MKGISLLKHNDHNINKIINLIKNIDIAFEFRDSLWFNDNTYNIMKKYNTTIAIVNINNKFGWTTLNNGFNPTLDKFVKTSSYIYVRFHGSKGQYIGSYDTKVLRELINFIEPLHIKKAYIYFNNTDSNSNISKLSDAIHDSKKLYDLINNE